LGVPKWNQSGDGEEKGFEVAGVEKVDKEELNRFVAGHAIRDPFANEFGHEVCVVVYSPASVKGKYPRYYNQGEWRGLGWSEYFGGFIYGIINSEGDWGSSP